MKINAVLAGIICMITFCSCKKSTGNGNGGGTTPNPPKDTTVIITPPVDPAIANTIGFFLDDWLPKTFTTPSYKDTAIPFSTSYSVTVNPGNVITKVPMSIYGNNANLWMTQMVTEASLITDITKLHPHIIRFPGGSISDVFFWNAPKNTPPADAPTALVNANGTLSANPWWFGKNSESWTFSVDNYYNMLQQTGNTGMIIINYAYARYGTGTNPVATAAHLAADWVRYDNGRTKYWEIGNENYGDWEAGYRIDVSKNKDGQPEYVTGDLYGQHFKVFADSMRKAAQEIGKTIYIGAVTAEAPPQSWETNTRKTWNTGLFSKAGNTPDFYIVHDYFTAYQINSNAADILSSPATETKKMMDFVTQSLQAAALTLKPIALTEYNINAEGSMQKVSHINGMHAIMVLGEALKNKYGMAARWDLANAWDNGNDHGMFSNGDEPGVPKWNARPAFYHMYYFQKFFGDRLVASLSDNTDLFSYASSFTSGQIGVTLVNRSSSAQLVQVKFQNFNVGNRYYWYTLTGGGDNGEFSRKVLVNGQGPSSVAGGPSNYASITPYSATTINGVNINVPARAIVYMVIDKK
jgi:hypothetical protein